MELRAREAWQSPLDTVTGSGILLDGTLYAAGYRRNKWWMGIDWTTGQVTCEQKELTTGAARSLDQVSSPVAASQQRTTSCFVTPSPTRPRIPLPPRPRIRRQRDGDTPEFCRIDG